MAIVLVPSARRNFDELSEREVLALAIALEEEDGRIYADFAEGLRDSFPASAGRGKPLVRGLVCGAMTTAGGIGHTLPYLIPGFYAATAVAVAVVAVELAAIAYIRHRFMDTPLLRAAFQVVLGGVLVFIVGILIGSA